ncbi:MAG TPA: NAD-dependent epimerase/dehydratase family protein [Pirellulales bacterium]
MFVLVTGATGSLGREIVRQLHARGDRVRILCRDASSHARVGAIHEALPARQAAPRVATPGLAHENGHNSAIPSNGFLPGVELALGDVRDPAAVQAAVAGVDAVIHTAGLASIWGPWKTFHAVNTVGTQNVIEAVRKNGVKKLVYTSSPSVVFNEIDQCNADESAPYTTRWLCHYPHSKALGEQAVLAANGQDGLHTCVLRPHLIWGPGDRQLIPRLLAQARSGRLRKVGDGKNVMDIVFVENAARAHIQAADALSRGSPACGKPYFISQGEPVNCWQWIDEILRLADLPPVGRGISLANAQRLGRTWEAAYRLLGVRKEPPLTRFLALQLGRSHWFSIAAARRDFGYEPAVSTAEGMERLKVWLDEV